MDSIKNTEGGGGEWGGDQRGEQSNHFLQIPIIIALRNYATEVRERDTDRQKWKWKEITFSGWKAKTRLLLFKVINSFYEPCSDWGME